MKIITDSISLDEIKQMAEQMFGNMVKVVADVDKKIMAIDGELHADEEALLLENGSKQQSLWGINIYPELCGEDFIEFDSMINLGVAERSHGKLSFNNVGVLLFAKEPCKFFQSAYIDAVVFKGTDRVDIIDRKTFKGGLFENLNHVHIYLQKHLNLRYEYKEDWRRRNIYELPMDALREAAVNALIHRDYFMSGANIFVCIFDDRVEIVSPGGLPKPLTLKDLGKRSKRRNETIADLFSRLDFVEKLGTGVRKMRRWMREQGLKPPRIEVDGFFTIIFKRPQKAVKSVGKMSGKNVGKKKRKALILKKIRTKDSFTLVTLAREIGVSEKTIERDVEELKKDGEIKFVGPKRGGHYEMGNK